MSEKNWECNYLFPIGCDHYEQHPLLCCELKAGHKHSHFGPGITLEKLNEKIRLGSKEKLWQDLGIQDPKAFVETAEEIVQHLKEIGMDGADSLLYSWIKAFDKAKGAGE